MYSINTVRLVDCRICFKKSMIFILYASVHVLIMRCLAKAINPQNSVATYPKAIHMGSNVHRKPVLDVAHNLHIVLYSHAYFVGLLVAKLAPRKFQIPLYNID